MAIFGTETMETGRQTWIRKESITNKKERERERKLDF